MLLLSQLAASPRADVAGAVETGAGAPQRCYASATDPTGCPCLPGRGTPCAHRVAERRRRPPPGAAPGETELAASCGTPVLAASAGTVQVVRDDRAAGPWKIGVRRASPATTMWYSHVRRPLVRTGTSVLVGQPIAEVGDLGRVDACRLGLALTVGTGAAAKSVDVLPWLTSHGAAVAEPKKPAKKDKKQKKGPKGDGPDLPDVVAATTFRAATFNVLGSHLTDPGGDKASYDSGPSRMARGLSVLEASGVSVVAFQEFETPQANAVLADGDWSLQRATPNNRFRNGNAGGNAIAWRRDTWSLVSTGEFTVPWQVTLHMPTVTLRNIDTGAELTVIGVHNPASTDKQGDQQRARNVARGIELSLGPLGALGRTEHTGAARRGHERAGRGVLQLHRRWPAGFVRGRQHRRRLPRPGVRRRGLDLRHPGPRLRLLAGEPADPGVDQRPPAGRRAGRDPGAHLRLRAPTRSGAGASGQPRSEPSSSGEGRRRPVSSSRRSSATSSASVRVFSSSRPSS